MKTQIAQTYRNYLRKEINSSMARLAEMKEVFKRIRMLENKRKYARLIWTRQSHINSLQRTLLEWKDK